MRFAIRGPKSQLTELGEELAQACARPGDRRPPGIQVEAKHLTDRFALNLSMYRTSMAAPSEYAGSSFLVNAP